MKASRRRLLLAAAACILVPSLGMLLATFYNRSGTPGAIFVLTERELRLPTVEDGGEGPALAFGLIWRVEAMGHADFAMKPASSSRLVWMTSEKAAEFGIKTADDARRRPIVPAFLVLEFNGRTYARELERACRTNPEPGTCNTVARVESRLYVVDIGSDAAALRKKYSDGSIFAIVRGTVGFSGNHDDTAIEAHVAGLDVDTVQASEPIRSARAGASRDMSWFAFAGGKPFSAVVAFGRRLEPWNVSLSTVPHAAAPSFDQSVNQRFGRSD